MSSATSLWITDQLRLQNWKNLLFWQKPDLARLNYRKDRFLLQLTFWIIKTFHLSLYVFEIFRTFLQVYPFWLEKLLNFLKQRCILLEFFLVLLKNFIVTVNEALFRPAIANISFDPSYKILIIGKHIIRSIAIGTFLLRLLFLFLVLPSFQTTKWFYDTKICWIIFYWYKLQKSPGLSLIMIFSFEETQHFRKPIKWM